MFGSFVYEKISAEYEKKLLLWDDDSLFCNSDRLEVFIANGFKVVTLVIWNFAEILGYLCVTNISNCLLLLIQASMCPMISKGVAM